MSSTRQDFEPDEYNATRKPSNTSASVNSSAHSFGGQRTSFRNSINLKTMTFLRGIMGQRNQDYVSDAPQSYAASQSSHSLRQQQNQSMRSMNVQETIVEEGTRSSLLRWCCPQRRSRVSCCDPLARKQFLWRLLNDRFWKAPLICFTFILLFGAQIRDLFIPKEGDLAVDIVFMVAFVFFWIDIIFRMDAETNYFQSYLCCSIGYSSGFVGSTRTSSGMGSNGSSVPSEPATGIGHTPSFCGFQGRPFHLGSFLFWCDVISAMALLREISFIDITDKFVEPRIHIRLDEFGMPISMDGFGQVNEANPIEYNSIDMLTIILKSARVARFIRSSAAVKLASRIDWFGIINRINPIYYLGRWWKKRQQRKDGPPTEIAARSRGDILNRRASWSAVIFASKVQAQTQPINPPHLEKRGVLGKILKALHAVGIIKDNKEELRRQLAATRIQRAWRRQRDQHLEGEGHEGDDVAWKGRGSAIHAMDRVLKKRSILQHTMSSRPSHLSTMGAESERTTAETTRKRRNESQVGTAMRELTGKRVAMGIIISLIVTVLLTYQETSATRPTTMVVLHSQTSFENFANQSLAAAKSSSVPGLYEYILANGENRMFSLENGLDPDDLKQRERLRIVVEAPGSKTMGYFSYRDEIREEALVSIISTIFVLLVWFFGVTSFAGPVMILVVIPIERMVRLLDMLMLDPLGYQSTSRYKRFVSEEDEITKNTPWTKEVLKGMETSFLMSTILRIGSLMKVGFGSAGVEIIRNNLEKGQTKNMIMLSSQGSTVSCIFLFSDIRQFTDCTECLQEEVFVFTNRIAAVVHSICHSYGGSANKNIGDAFLLSWLLDEDTSIHGFGKRKAGEAFAAKHNQADKALLSVVKICMALHHDEYYVGTMSEGARDALLAKLSKRKALKAPLVQMGFGLHAGTAVQGAIGSTRKIDATYVSEAVERAEFLESSTKKYGLKMLMSDSFHRLLTPNQRRRCRKIDQIIIRNEDDDDNEDGLPEGDMIELLTFDMDIDALWRESKQGARASKSDTGRESDSDVGSEKGSKPQNLRTNQSLRQVSSTMIAKSGRRRSVRMGLKDHSSDELSEGGFMPPGAAGPQAEHTDGDAGGPPELSLPTGPAMYNPNVWVSPEMKKMRQRYTDGLFFQNFNTGLMSFYAKDWDDAKQCFANILDRFEDGPSRYFLDQIKKHKGKPPRNFLPYGVE